MLAPNLKYMMTSERNAVRHALAAERVRASHFREALAGAKDKRVRSRWGRQLNASLGRAATLALALVDMGEAVPLASVCSDFDGRLLDAMDLSVRTGQMPTAAAITRDSAARRTARVGRH
ncbi:MAG: hypothetical protein ACREPY_04960 [Rhodanobacteraceae bacterium]